VSEETTDAAIARLTRERDDEHCDFEAANYDCARLINAIRGAVDLDDVRGLAEECASNGRSGWIPQALQIDTRTEGRWLKLVDERDCARRENEILLRERDEARALASEMSAAYTLMSETVVGQGKQLDEARAAAAAERVEANEAIGALHDARAEVERLRSRDGANCWHWCKAGEREALLALAMVWGRELAERCEPTGKRLLAAHDAARDAYAQLDASRAELARLRERVAFYELGHYRATALRDALSSEEAEALRGVLAEVERSHEPIGYALLSAKVRRWERAGRPLLAGVPSPASEGGEHGR
jgi:hypothetical protein